MVAYWDKSGCSFQGANPAPDLLLVSKGRGTVAPRGSLHHTWRKGGGRKGKQTHHLSSLEGKCLDWRDSDHCLSSQHCTGLSFGKGQMLMTPSRLVSSCTSKGTGHKENKDCDRDIQEVSCSIQELTVFICSHSYGSIQQQRGTATLVLILAISSPTAQSHVYQPSTEGITV